MTDPTVQLIALALGSILGGYVWLIGDVLYRWYTDIQARRHRERDAEVLAYIEAQRAANPAVVYPGMIIPWPHHASP